jgi:hypothetical protein
MPADFNPDKERHVDHKWFVINNQRKPVEGVEVDGKQLKFGHEGWLRVSDAGQAQAIREKYGRDVTVSRIRHPDVHDRGHRFHFGQWPEMPWKRQVNNEHQTEERPHQETPRDGSPSQGNAPGRKTGEESQAERQEA